MTDNTKMREEFEKWHMERYGGFGLGRSTEPGYTDEYERAGTNLQWAAWQAAQSVAVVGEPVADGLDEDIRQTMRFYSVTDLISLVRIQSEHVARLQKKLPPMRDEQPRNPRYGGE